MEEKLLEILEQICDDDIVREDLELDLVEEGLLDSIAVVELIVAIEEEFGVSLSPFDGGRSLSERSDCGQSRDNKKSQKQRTVLE